MTNPLVMNYPNELPSPQEVAYWRAFHAYKNSVQAEAERMKKAEQEKAAQEMQDQFRAQHPNEMTALPDTLPAYRNSWQAARHGFLNGLAGLASFAGLPADIGQAASHALFGTPVSRPVMDTIHDAVANLIGADTKERASGDYDIPAFATELATGLVGPGGAGKTAARFGPLAKRVITAEAAQPSLRLAGRPNTPLANILNTNWTGNAAGEGQSEAAQQMIRHALAKQGHDLPVHMGQGFWQDAAGRQFNAMGMMDVPPGMNGQQVGAKLGHDLYQYGVGEGEINRPTMPSDWLAHPLQTLGARAKLSHDANAVGVRVGDNEDAAWLAKRFNPNADVDTLMVHDPAAGFAYLKPMQPDSQYQLGDILEALKNEGWKGRPAYLGTDFVGSAP